MSYAPCQDNLIALQSRQMKLSHVSSMETSDFDINHSGELVIWDRKIEYYDTLGRVILEKYYPRIRIGILADSPITSKYYYSRINMLINKEISSYDADTTLDEYFYDGKGNKIKELETVKATGKTSAVSYFIYDSLNRLIGMKEYSHYTVHAMEKRDTAIQPSMLISYEYGNKSWDRISRSIYPGKGYPLHEILFHKTSEGYYEGTDFDYNKYDTLGRLIEWNEDKNGHWLCTYKFNTYGLPEERRSKRLDMTGYLLRKYSYTYFNRLHIK